MINNLFTCPVYESQLNLDEKVISTYCLSMKDRLKSVVKSNVNGWQSSITENEINIKDEIIKHVNIFNNTLKSTKPFSIQNMWVNINGYKDYNIEHTHPGAILSGVYYSQTKSNSGDIVFIHPAKDSLIHDWDNFEWQEYNQHNSSTWWFTPSVNKLFLFPSWLKHYVKPNLNNEERISISFNLV